MPHVQLRTVTNDDLLIFFKQQIDQIACEMAAFPSRDLIPFMAHWERVMRDPSVSSRTILCDGEIAGNIVSYGPATERCIGYWIGRAFWGQGVATSALRDYLEIELVRPLIAFVAEHNVASMR
ncbi:MAG: GNAT family N-acetyltransferase, partial [Thermomicrobiales bacterium]|nr:GNAT family N-acetyltransferase [Thermomicrobiales bacterium]